MSSPPPSYYGTTTVSEKPSMKSEKPAGSRTYHLTLERRKWTIMLACGLAGCMGLIEQADAAITIPDNADWDKIRKEIFRLYKKAWPAILGKAKLEDYAITVHMDYTAQDGGPYRQVSMLEYDGDALWQFRKRDDINIIKFCASCSPLKGEAPGKVRSSEYVRKHLGVYEQKPRMETKPKEGSKSKHHCILQ